MNEAIEILRMIDQWYRGRKLNITPEEFQQLPRNAAYKYEYAESAAVLTPQPRNFNAILDLTHYEPPMPAWLPELPRPRVLAAGDWEPLIPLFAAAFARVEPFAALSQAERLQAACGCLIQTRTGGDGPLVSPACFIAEASGNSQPIGAILVTLIPRREPGEWWAGDWKNPPADAIPKRLGRPHLTWIFVMPELAAHGLGSLLLDRAVNALRELGYAELATTFLAGNDSSMLWHWRNGFKLLPYPGSRRCAPLHHREGAS